MSKTKVRLKPGEVQEYITWLERIATLAVCHQCGEVPTNPDGWMPGICPSCQAEELAAEWQESAERR